MTVPEVRRLLAIALPLPVRSPEVRLAWSTFRREARDSGLVTVITGVVPSEDPLVHALMRPHNYGCSTRKAANTFHSFPVLGRRRTP